MIMSQYGILDRLHSSRDVAFLSMEECRQLCIQLRRFLLDHVSRTGGHLSSNLGAVELTVALHRVFDTSRDRLIFDVGHQCYCHKILTGRKDGFARLRQFGGLSGFPRSSESVHDAASAGHASVSISTALGMAHARTLLGQDYRVACVIGDGAMTGGVAYEALGDAGNSGEPLVVVLNDNEMSITKNVGALSEHLSNLRVSPQYLNAKKQVKRVLGRLPYGQSIERGLGQMKAGLKTMVLPGTLFENMGFSYLGPIDGHDIRALCQALRAACALQRPVLLHVVTQKGRGYPPAEREPERYHGVGPFDLRVGLPKTAGGKSFSSVFGQTLTDLAQSDGRICAITAAMQSGTGLDGFAKRHPQRFFDVSIAEEHAAAMAAGLARQGMKPVCAIYSTFLQRSYDQLLHDIAIDHLPVVLAVDRAGVVGADGETHNGVFDVAFLRTVPGLRLFAPSSYAELTDMLTTALRQLDGPVAIRYPRGGEGEYRDNRTGAPVVCLQEGDDLTLVSYGIMINQALLAARRLKEQGIACAVWKVNELTGGEIEPLLSSVRRTGRLAVMEDVVSTGSYGSFLAQQLARRQILVRQLFFFDVGDRFLPQGSVQDIWRMCGVDGESAARRIKEEWRVDEDEIGCPPGGTGAVPQP